MHPAILEEKSLLGRTHVGQRERHACDNPPNRDRTPFLVNFSRLIPDPFVLALLSTIALATLFPVAGAAAAQLGVVATAAIMLLFFLHGVRLPRENLLAALTHWRLHLLILCTTYLLFPLLGLILSRSFPALLPAGLWAGVLFLCALPSTVQMSIAYTSVAGGNVAAAVTSAAASNLLGIALTPLIAGLLLSTQSGGEVPLSGIWKVMLQLLLPFVVGHLLRPWLGAWAMQRKKTLTYVDRATIMLSIYSAFSAAVIAGIWQQVPLQTLFVLVAVCATILTIVMTFTLTSARIAGFSTADGRTVQYCGTFKSLVSGVPMARVLFPSAELGAIILPIMVYHQLQLMVSATIAPRQGKKSSGN
jgi:solute carrier family 10 (sodium/bile acid cotransporter), member 7